MPVNTHPTTAWIDCITIGGHDARRFAQAQFASNVDHLLPGHWQWSAWLTARGRVRMLMQLADPGDGRLIAVLRGGAARALLAELARYRLRAPVTLGLQTLDGCAGPAMDTGLVRTGSEDLILGCGTRSLQLRPRSQPVDDVAQTAWRLADISAGWPTLPATLEPRFLPPALGLEHLGAVDVSKGCYPGQEIAARLHFRGGHKHRLFHVRGTSPVAIGEVGGGVEATIWVMDVVNGLKGVDALIVAPESATSAINMLQHAYNVISRFPA